MKKSDFKSVGFRQPFLAESFALFSFADRAVPLGLLDSIDTIKRVAILTVGFLGIDCTRTPTVNQDIAADSQQIQMFDVNACSVATPMIDDQSIRNLAVNSEPGDTMRFPGFPTQIERSVAVFVEIAPPGMTGTVLLEPGLESGLFGRCEIHGVSVHGSDGKMVDF